MTNLARPILLLTAALTLLIGSPLTAQNVDAINPTTLVVAQIDMKSLKLSGEGQPAKTTQTNASTLNEFITSLRSSVAPMLDDQLSIMVDVPFSSAQLPVRFVAQKPAEFDLDKLNKGLAAYRLSPAVVQDRTVATAPVGNLSESNKVLVSRDTLPIDLQAWNSAAKAVKTMPIRILVAPPAYLSTTYEDLMPRLPDSWGGLPSHILTQGVYWAAIGIDPAKNQTQIVIQSKTAAAAERLAAELPKLMTVAKQNKALSNYKALMDSFNVEQLKVNQDRLEISVSHRGDSLNDGSLGVQLLSALIDPMRMRQQQDRYRQIILAMLNYESANKVLPPNQAARRPDGTSYLSWRVHLLPYLGEEKLYKEFKLDESWDSKHNQQLLNKMPAIFANDATHIMAPTLPAGHTTVVAPVGEGTVFGSKKPVPFGLIKDGLSNTVFLVEVKPDRAVPWTAPMDYEYPEADPGIGLAVGGDGQTIIGLGDSSVQLLPASFPKETLLRLFQMNDGKVIEWP